jgi:osmotically-inducible protein OsmY
MLRRTHALVMFLSVGLIGAGVLPGCASLGDAGITSQVHARLDLHPALEPPNLIRVQTLDGVVYLYGLVDTAFERELAEAIARETPGVARVVNSIGISGNR